MKTKKEIFTIQSFLTDEDKLQLKRNVDQKLNLKKSSNISEDNEMIKNILEIVRKNTTIVNEPQLVNELERYLLNSKVKEDYSQIDKNMPSLNDLLPSSHIQIYPKVDSPEEAIQIASRPLITKGIITKEYVKKMIDLYTSTYSYMLISPEVAIPHASPNDGVNRIGMAFLKLEKPIKFAESSFVHFLFIIAPEDKEKHIRAISQLYELTKNKEFIADLKRLNYERDLKDYFDEFI